MSIREIKQWMTAVWIDRRFRFLLVGGLNSVFSFVLYSVLVILGMKPYIATIVVYPPSILHSYFWNKYFTFKTKIKSFAELLRFVVVYLVQLCVTVSIVYILVEMAEFNAYFSYIFAIVPATLVSWFGHKLFSFRDKA